MNTIRLFFTLTLFFAILPRADAYSRVYGWCEQGNQTISVLGYVSSTTTPTQRSYPSCSVTVYISGTGTKAPIYADNLGTALANPFTLGVSPESSSNGYYFFYVADGFYDVQISGTGVPTPFTLGAVTTTDPALFNTIRLMGVAGDFSSIASAYAAASSTGAWIVVGPGFWTEPTSIVLAASKPLHLSCSGQGSGTSGNGGSGVTVISFNGSGYLFSEPFNVVTDSVTIENCAFVIGGISTGWMQAGAFSEAPFGAFRYGWSFTNVTVDGPGVTNSSQIGMSLTNLANLTLTNFTIQNFYQTAVFDRPSVVTGSHVRFFKYAVGPLITAQAGSGAAAAYSAEMSLTEVEFLGPTTGSSQYCVTVDMNDVTFNQAIYEPETPGAQAAIRITAQARNFRDYGGYFSLIPRNVMNVNYTMVWDNGFTEMAFFGTMYIGSNTTPPICRGTPPACTGHSAVINGNTIGSAAICIGCSPNLYTQFNALNNLQDATATGSAPLSYGPYMAVTGPLWIDISTSTGGPAYEGLRTQLTKNGVVGDTVQLISPMLSSDQASFAPVDLEFVTESTSPGLVQAGAGIKIGNQNTTRYGIYCNGNVVTATAPTGGYCAMNGSLYFQQNLGRAGGCLGIHLYGGVGSPNGAQTGCIGDLFMNEAGGAGTTLYVKESGNNTNTGWIGK